MPDIVLRRRSLLAPTFAMLVAVAILLGLGTWQLERLRWKEALIARVTDRANAPAGAMPSAETWATTDFDSLDYTPVKVTGQLLHDKELHVFAHISEPRGRLGGPGYFILTPLALDNGSFVLVNRGFVPEAARDPATRVAGQITGAVTLDALLRRREPRDTFSPVDDPKRNIWFVRDARIMAGAIGLDPARVAPFTLDARASATPQGGLPQAGETVLRFPNNHLQYAVTWYGLALCCVGVYLAFALAQQRKSRRR